MECLKLDLRKVNFNKSLTWNVWKQFDIDIETYKEKRINVASHYMPTTEQYKLKDYLLDNYKKLKYYKPKNKTYINKAMAWEILCYFPNSVKEGEDGRSE